MSSRPLLTDGKRHFPGARGPPRGRPLFANKCDFLAEEKFTAVIEGTGAGRSERSAAPISQRNVRGKLEGS